MSTTCPSSTSVCKVLSIAKLLVSDILSSSKTRTWRETRQNWQSCWSTACYVHWFMFKHINSYTFLPELLRCQVTTKAVGADAEQHAEQQRQRVEHIDDARHVWDGEQQRTGNHHLYRPFRDNHHILTHTHTTYYTQATITVRVAADSNMSFTDLSFIW